jgi:D-3-phosphoglycerate dehydrogenase / 2-oxoglutarate reductase
VARMKVAVTDYIEDNLDWEAGELSKAGLELAAFQLKFKPDDEVLAKIGDADIIVVNMLKMTDAILSRLPRCRLLIRHGIGYDNVDVAACTKHGIPFAYQPDYCTEDVAEHAIALLLACARKVPSSRAILDRSVAKGQWDFAGLFPMYRMQGKTLGIVGVGRIGSRVAQKLASFGFRIVGNDPYLGAERKKELGLEWVDQQTLFKESDYVSIHTPLNDETRHLVNAKTLGLMKRTAYLVNTARGGMVDIPALASALKAGAIAGAALDVYDREPPPPEFPLYGMDNVILTPHTAWASEESGWQIRKNIVADILSAAKGGQPRSLVNKGVKARVG